MRQQSTRFNLTKIRPKQRVPWKTNMHAVVPGTTTKIL